MSSKLDTAMSYKLDTLDAVIFLFIGLMASVILSVIDNQTVANEVANKVTNTETNIVTETEVYKVVCVAPADTFCKEYSVRRLNRE